MQVRVCNELHGIAGQSIQMNANVCWNIEFSITFEFHSQQNRRQCDINVLNFNVSKFWGF